MSTISASALAPAWQPANAADIERSEVARLRGELDGKMAPLLALRAERTEVTAKLDALGFPSADEVSKLGSKRMHRDQAIMGAAFVGIGAVLGVAGTAFGKNTHGIKRLKLGLLGATAGALAGALAAVIPVSNFGRSPSEAAYDAAYRSVERDWAKKHGVMELEEQQRQLSKQYDTLSTKLERDGTLDKANLLDAWDVRTSHVGPHVAREGTDFDHNADGVLDLTPQGNETRRDANGGPVNADTRRIDELAYQLRYDGADADKDGRLTPEEAIRVQVRSIVD